MIGYTCVGTNDLQRAISFYDELFELIGAKRFFKTERGVGWGISHDKPMFSVMQPFDGEKAVAGNGNMVALAATSPDQVQAIHRKALELGGIDEGAPGPRGGNFYGAYFRDLDGNKLATFCILQN